MKRLNSKIFLYKYNIDIFSNLLLKGYPFSNTAKKILDKFENVIRTKMIRLLKAADFKFHQTPPKVPFPQTFTFLNLSVDKKKKLTRVFFNTLFKYYSLQKNFTIKRNLLLNYWMRSRLFRIKRQTGPKLFKLNYVNFYAIEKKKPYIKRPPYIIKKKLDFWHYKIYFCFSNKFRFTNFLKKYEYPYKHHKLQLGLNSLLLDFFFKLNFFPNTKFVYNFLKLGTITINGLTTRNPHKNLSVFDRINVLPQYINLLNKYLIWRLKNKKVLFNIPNYIDYDLKVMSFYIWRVPETKELHLDPTFPFQRPVILDYKLYKLRPKKFRRFLKRS